jgi:hypothetical protein
VRPSSWILLDCAHAPVDMTDNRMKAAKRRISIDIPHKNPNPSEPEEAFYKQNRQTANVWQG